MLQIVMDGKMVSSLLLMWCQYKIFLSNSVSVWAFLN